jgi:hypothetical protein
LKTLTEAEQKMLDELREKAQTVLDYMQRNGMTGFHRVGFDIVPDYKGKPYINVDAITHKGNEYRSASLCQFQHLDMEWTTHISEWRGKNE